MKSFFKLSSVALTALVLTASCGKSEEKQEAQNPLEALQKIGEQAQEIQKNGGQAKETIDPKLLKELLPADADGLKRTEAESEKTSIMGFGVSTAKAKYASDDQSINIEIIDVTGTGVAIMGMAAWSMASIDRETEHGYEKTTEYEGHKAFEKYNTDSKDGEISVLVASRYIVNVTGNNVDISKIKATLDDIDLDKLGGMK